MTEEEALRAHEPLIAYLVKRYSKVPGVPPVEDLMQEARIAFLKAHRGWDPARSALSTHAFWIIRADLRHLVESAVCSKRRSSLYEIRLDDTAYDEGRSRSNHEMYGTPADQEDRYLDAEEKELLRRSVGRLAKDQRTVVELTLLGKTQREIAAEMRISKSRVDQIYQAAVLRLKAMLHASLH